MKYKNLLILFICIILTVIVISSLVFNSRLKTEHEKVSFYFNNALLAINEIQDSLMIIDNRETMLRHIVFNSDLTHGIEINPKDQIMMSIQNINDYIANSKKRISLLEEQLQKNNLQISGLQRLINNLKLNIKEKEDLILSLNSQIDYLTEMIVIEREKALYEISKRDDQIEIQYSMLTEMERDILEKEQLILNKKTEEYTIYYFIGTRRELIDNGFLTKGGLFRASQKTSNYRQDVMVKMNLLEFQEIIINSRFNKIRVLSEQDKSSYIIEDYGNQSLFKIINPEEFKKIKYLLIVID